MEKAVNLKQLSQRLGLSQTTVSRALNGFPEVSEKTRARVREMAQELNYRPSVTAHTLATGKTRTIGHIVPVSEHRMINPHFTDFLAGASEAYAERGYELLLRAAHPEYEEAIYREFAERRRVDGVVVHGPRREDRRIRLLQEIGLPFVVHGRAFEDNAGYSWLDVNNRAAFRLLTNHFCENGHRQIGLVNGLEDMNFAELRRKGFELALQDNGLVANPQFMFSADMTEPYGYRATREMLQGDEGPTAIIYSSVLCAMGGVRAMGELGLRIGRDVAVGTFDDRLSFLQPETGGAVDPFFTCIASSIQDAGRRVAEMLIEQIADPELPPQHELWEAKLNIARPSVADGQEKST